MKNKGETYTEPKSITTLPIEVLTHIFSFLNPHHISSAAGTSRLFAAIARSDALWNSWIMHYFPQISDREENKRTSKGIFIEVYQRYLKFRNLRDSLPLLPILKKENEPIEDFTHVDKELEEAALTGNLPRIKWIIKNHLEDKAIPGSIIEVAAQFENYNIIEWLLENYGSQIPNSNKRWICPFIALNGQIERLKDYWEKSLKEGFLDPERVFISACEGGHLHIVNWILEQETEISPRMKREAFNTAARAGQRHILEFLYKQDDSIEIHNFINALSDAIKYEHLEVLKFIWEVYIQTPLNKGVWTTALALEKATDENSLSIVAWLCENPVCNATFKDKKAALFCAINRGHLDIVKYFFEKHNQDVHPLIEEMFYTACAVGHFPIVKWLWDNFNQHISHTTVLSAFLTIFKPGETTGILNRLFLGLKFATYGHTLEKHISIRLMHGFLLCWLQKTTLIHQWKLNIVNNRTLKKRKKRKKN